MTHIPGSDDAPTATDEDGAPVSYEAAADELEQIVARLESGDIDVDHLATAVTRATALITHCRTRLRAVEADLERALAEVDAPDGGPADVTDDEPAEETGIGE